MSWLIEITTYEATRNEKYTNGSAIAIILALLAQPALAQTVPNEAQPAAREVETVVVTGSRIARSRQTASVPVAAIGAEELRLAGTTNSEDLLNAQPQFVPATTSASNSLARATGTSAATLDLRGIGVKVDLQAMDFGAMAARRSNKAAPEAGGWHLGLSYWPGVDISNPVANTPMQASCEKARAGWPCDAAHQSLIDSFAYAQSDEARQKIANEVQASAYNLVPYVPIGLWYNPIAYRRSLTGVLSDPGTSVYWNIKKTPPTL